MEDPDYGRAVLENFFWDYFQQYSDARPILRTARELEGKALRLAHDLMQWSYAPLWFYRVEDRTHGEARLRNLGNGRIHRVHHAGRMPGAGTGMLARILPFRGREFCGHAVLAFEAHPDHADLDSLFRAGCRDLGIKPAVNLRPDVHCEEWRRHGAIFLELWRGTVYDSKVGRPYRGSGPPPVLNLRLREKGALVRALAAAEDVSATGPDTWDLRYRALRLARLEAKGGSLLVTLVDPAFRDAVRSWLREKAGQAVAVAGKAGPAAGESPSASESIPADGHASLDVWMHTSLEVLNGQTPIQASTHDWGKRKLQSLLKEMTKLGRDVTSVRQQLGL
jgi:hypothetical protein